MVRVEEHDKRIVAHRFTLVVTHIERIARKQHADAAVHARRPVLYRHLAAVRVEPHDIFQPCLRDTTALKILGATENRMLLPESNEARRESAEFLLPGSMVPIEPRDLIVLAI